MVDELVFNHVIKRAAEANEEHHRLDRFFALYYRRYKWAELTFIIGWLGLDLVLVGGSYLSQWHGLNGEQTSLVAVVRYVAFLATEAWMETWDGEIV